MIHIAKSGFKCFEWNTSLRQYVEEEFNSIYRLRDGVTQVDEDVTLGDIITLTYKDEFLRGFIGAYSGCSVSAFYEELSQGVKPLDPVNQVKYCTVALDVRITETHRKSGLDRSVEAGMDFGGRGKEGDAGEGYGLDLSSLAEIAALPFRLENNATAIYYGDDTYDRKDGLAYTPSLLELLDAIFFDISFHGSPADKAGRLLDLKAQVKAIIDETAQVVPLNLHDDKTVQ